MRAAAEQVGLGTGAAFAPQRAGAAEDVLPALEQPGLEVAFHRAQVGEDRERLFLAAMDLCKPLHVDRQVARDAGLGRALLVRLVQHLVEPVERDLERRRRRQERQR